MASCRMVVSFVVLLCAVGVAVPAQEKEAELSAKQLEVVAQKTAKLSAAEKAIMKEWSPGKNAAEFICQDLALKELGKTYKGADRVFMDKTEADPRPRLVTQSLLVGEGSVRHSGGWTDFSYECDLDPEKGTATAFRLTEAGGKK